MKIIAYTFEAAVHCVDCTLARHAKHPFALTDCPEGTGNDETGLPYAAEDREGNPVHPVFSTDEITAVECCDDCLCPIS